MSARAQLWVASSRMQKLWECTDAPTMRARRRPLNRRYIVVEGIYANTGDVAPLAEIARLKYKCALCFWSGFAVAPLVLYT